MGWVHDPVVIPYPADNASVDAALSLARKFAEWLPRLVPAGAARHRSVMTRRMSGSGCAPVNLPDGGR